LYREIQTLANPHTNPPFSLSIVCSEYLKIFLVQNLPAERVRNYDWELTPWPSLRREPPLDGQKNLHVENSFLRVLIREHG
jgi:hypothetical protein